VKEISISELKAKCFGILEGVRKTRKPIRVTRFGKPFVDIFPIQPKKHSQKRRLGRMAGSAEIVGDIVGPTGSLNDWDSWRDEE
jgi:prevent-host-death family protein